MAWTDERVDTLKKLWADGLSASQIAGKLGEVTRNAVIGKVHRLGLSGRITTVRNKTVRPRETNPRTKTRVRGYRQSGSAVALREFALQAGVEAFTGPAYQPAEELVIPLHERATILTLKESSCRWPIGDPQHEDFHFCGRNKVTGLPYCEFHARRAFQPVQQRRRDQSERQIIAMHG